MRLVVDHVIARQHQGPTALENLALCCQWCNLSKGPNLTGLDPQTGDVFRLFNPRVDKWDEHFHWADGLVVPTTGVARVTVAVLKINHPDRVDVRVGLIREGKLKLD